VLPLDPGWEPVTLGEGNTPLVSETWYGYPLLLKLESLAPTGSFKDRGMAVLTTALRGLGVERVVEDSSGNAGASLAAYAARAGIACDICVPDTAEGPKLTQMAAHGAEVIQIKGKREYSALAAWAAAAHGAYYASHVYNPYFLAGTETCAYEVWEQLENHVPAAIVLPVGNGSLLLGLFRGFERLQRAGLIEQLPQLYAVQTEACAPIYRAFQNGGQFVPAVTAKATVARGIAVAQPARGSQILAAVQTSRGAVVTVTEPEIEQAADTLAHKGFYVEMTSAAAMAAIDGLRHQLPEPGSGQVIVLLTGHGLKTNSIPH
jgi:threonine synthase